MGQHKVIGASTRENEKRDKLKSFWGFFHPKKAVTPFLHLFYTADIIQEPGRHKRSMRERAIRRVKHWNRLRSMEMGR
jgi:hypothetical protein